MWRLLLLAAVALAGCDRAAERPSPAADGPGAAWWTGAAQVASVTGYAFRNPSNRPESLLNGYPVALDRLEELKTRQAVVLPADHARFRDAVFGEHAPVPAGNCYIPHHIFLAQDSGGRAVGAVEVCFMCRHVHILPKPSDPILPDWIALARLCESWQLGLGPAYESAAEFEAELRRDGVR